MTVSGSAGSASRPVASGGGGMAPTKRFDALFCRIDLVKLVLFGNVMISVKKIASSTVVSVIKSSPLKLFAIFSLRLSIFP